MNKRQRNPIFLLLCIILVLSLAGCGQSNIDSPQTQASAPSSNSAPYPITITNFNAAGKPLSVTYKLAPSRVVITHPGATELLLELGLEDRILSTVAPYGAPLDRIAEKYAKLNIMSAQFVPSQEELIAMQPDMIIGWAHHFDESKLGNVKNWQERGMATYVMQSSLTNIKPTLENVVYACIADMGKIFDIQEKTDQYIKNSKERVALVENAVKDVPKKKNVIVLQDHSNGTFSMYDSSYLISHMIDIAGGKNLCENPAFLVSAEQILAFDPDVIIFVAASRKDSTKDLPDEEALEHIRGIKELQSMRAIREGNIMNLPFFTVNNGGVRTIDAIEKIARGLYPERFK